VNRKRLAWIAGALLAAAAIAVLAFAATLRSMWVRNLARERLVAIMQTATGGRVEIGSLSVEWRPLRAEVRGITIHGTEAAGKPPLFHADAAAIGLKIVSVFERRVNIESLDVSNPHLYVIVSPDGRTNVPEPKTSGGGNAMESVLDLAIGRFDLRNGLFEIESRGSAPFEAHGRNLNTRFAYEPKGKRYRGRVSIQPLDLAIQGYARTAADIDVALSIERDRMLVESAELRTGNSRFRLSGEIAGLTTAPRAAFQYQARVSQADVARFLETKLLESGTVESAGSATWTGPGEFAVGGDLHAYGLEYRDAYVWLRQFKAEGAVSAGPRGLEVTDLRASGFYAPDSGRLPMDLRVRTAAVRGSNIDFRGLSISAAGGMFQGEALLENLNRFHAKGDIAGFQARRIVAIYSPQALPWDARASGPVAIEAALKGDSFLRVRVNLEVAPEAGGAPVRGRVTANYDTDSKTLDLGRSILNLPSSRAEVSGVVGRALTVHLETRDLGDVLPALGEDPGDFPARLEGGAAVLNAVVSGDIGDPAIRGRLTARGFSLVGQKFDSLAADVTASATHVKAENVVLSHGALRAQGAIEAALRDWKTAPSSAIFGNATVRDAPASDAAALAGWEDAPVSGALGGSAQILGTVGSPIIQAEFTAAAGAFNGEPFDRVTGRAAYSRNTLELSSGQIAAGAKHALVSAAYAHTPGDFSEGRLRFEITTNPMPLDQIRTLQEARPGLAGTARLAARGMAAIRPPTSARRAFDLVELNADLAANGVALNGAAFGNARIEASTEGGSLRARLTSDFAGSAVSGEGSWRLLDDYPGSASVSFAKLDLARLRTLLAKTGGPSPFSGSAEGTLRIEGPALRPEAMRAELRVEKLQVGPAPDGEPARAASPLLVRNNGPVVASLAGNVITIGSARLQGRETDFAVSGKASLDQASPLDLRVSGRMSAAILQDFFPDMTAAGSVAADATVRGAFDSPQINGRVEVQDVSLNLADFPNGISNGNGVILFSSVRDNTEQRATIQRLSARSGGGSIELSGFAAYSEGETRFQLHATAREVRVRYPAGVSTLANASLNLTGTSERSILSGNVTVLRTGFNVQSDIGSALSASSEPAQIPSAPTGPLGGLNFDVQVQTAPDVQVESSLTQDIVMEANLRLRGTLNNPGVVGRINFMQGQVLFFGSRYNIEQGTISFYNQTKIEPIVDIDLETRVQGIDVILTVAGPLGKLNLTPRSDPPLQFNQIVSLLATGQAPTNDPALLAQQTAAPQSWQQMGASALLGQAITSPVSGRLQRFFGVSSIRIDPLRPGVEYNPQARLTIQQQVTPSITVTYITVVTSSNPQVVSISWDISKQLSVSAVRDETGVFGLDFFVKRQFR
jgi:translocation and assembly module TamB